MKLLTLLAIPIAPCEERETLLFILFDAFECYCDALYLVKQVEYPN